MFEGKRLVGIFGVFLESLTLIALKNIHPCIFWFACTTEGSSASYYITRGRDIGFPSMCKILSEGHLAGNRHKDPLYMLLLLRLLALELYFLNENAKQMVP